MAAKLPPSDHLIYMTYSLDKSMEAFTSAGFTTLAGGRHLGSVTENLLVTFDDGVYFELIAFVSEDDPEIKAFTPERLAQWKKDRDGQKWYGKKEGWIDWAVGPPERLKEEYLKGINDKLAEVEEKFGEGKVKIEKYVGPIASGRITKTGKKCEWELGMGQTGWLPFFCGDVTPREWRVPLPDPPHPNKVHGISSLLFLSGPTPSDELVYKKAIQAVTTSDISSEPTDLSIVSSVTKETIKIVVKVPETEAEKAWVESRGSGLYKVFLKSADVDKEGEEKLPGIVF